MKSWYVRCPPVSGGPRRHLRVGLLLLLLALCGLEATAVASQAPASGRGHLENTMARSETSPPIAFEEAIATDVRGSSPSRRVASSTDAPKATLPKDLQHALIQGHKALFAFARGEAQSIAEAIPPAYLSSPDVRYFLGRLAFLGGRYQEALEHFGNTRFIDRAGEADDFPDYVRRVADAVDGLAVQESEHFSIRYDATGPDQILIPYAIDTLEEALKVLGAELDWRPPEKVRIEIFPDSQRFIQASGLQGSEIETTGTVALCVYNKLMITSPRALALGYRWMDTLSHELIHLLVAQKSHNQVPVWLQEGIAKFFEVRWREGRGADMSRTSESLLAEALEADKLVPFERMSPSLAKLPSAEEAQLAFAQVQTVIEYLILQRGLDGVHQLMLEMREGRTDRQAIEAVLGVSFAQFVTDWKKFMGAKRLRRLPGVAVLPTILRAQGMDEDGEEKVVDPFMARNKVLREFTRLGDLLRKRGRFQAALIEYQKGRESTEVESPALMVKMALTYLQGANHAAAQKLMIQTTERYPGFAPAYTTLGRAQLEAGDGQGAVKSFLEANAINPFDPLVHRTLSDLFRKQGKTKLAARERKAYERLMRFLVTG